MSATETGQVEDGAGGSAQRLQRVVVRMLYDPGLVAHIYGGGALEGLTTAELSLLRAPPRAAWATDPYRQSRTLHALLEEYPASAALCGVSGLSAFFQDALFHRAIMARASLALAFGAWLLPRAAPVAALEHAIARLRRRSLTVTMTEAEREEEEVMCAPHLLPVRLMAGTLAAHQQLCAALGPAPLERLMAQGAGPVACPPLGEGEEHWLLEVTVEGEGGRTVQVGGSSAGLSGLLSAAAVPMARGQLVREALGLGAESAEEAEEIIAGLIADGLLISSGS